MSVLPKSSMIFIILIVLALFSISVVTGHYLILFPIYILAIIASSNKAKSNFKTVFYLCLVSMLGSIYLAQSQRANLDSVDFIAAIIAALSTVAAYMILRSRNANKLEDTQINKAKLNESQEIKILQQFSGSVAHDFNNIMSVVMGNAELLKGDLSQPANSSQFIDAILGAVQQGTNLTEKLLTFSQKQFLQAADVNLNQLVIHHLAKLNLPINDRSKIHFAATEDLWTARIDATFFQECLLHLIRNAIQANAMHIEITVSNIIDNSIVDETLADSKRYLLIVISDDGIGIAVENLARIYQPFFTTRKSFAAKGLGLSTVYGFCHQSKGRIHVESTLGQGSTFKIIVPVAMSATSNKP
jgi:signal transduction histidine kinase